MKSNVHGGGERDRTELSTTDCHRLLADERRRTLLDVLGDSTLPVDLTTLAEDLATHDEDDAATVDELAISLHHRHLPMMDDLGVVDYDTDSRRVEVRRSSLELLDQ